MIQVPPHITNTKLHDDIRTRSFNSLVILRSERKNFLKRQFPFLFSKVFLSSLLVICLVASTSNVSFLKADSTVFYPTACLGGYDSLKLAEGKPETALDANADDFTIENSSYLPENRVADVYCGNFDGKVAEHTVPTVVKLTIHLTLKNKESSISKIETGHSSALLEVLDATTTPTLSEPLIQNNSASSSLLKREKDVIIPQIDKGKESTQVVVPVDVKVTKPEEHTLLKQISSHLSYVVSSVYAEESPQTDVPVTTVISSTESPSTSPPSPAQEIVRTVVNNSLDSVATTSVVGSAVDNVTVSSITVLEPTIASTTDNASSAVRSVENHIEGLSLIKTIVENLNPFSKKETYVATTTANPEYEILYSKGNDTWESLALLGKENTKTVTFILPYTPTSWKEIVSLQIHIKTLQNFEKRNDLYVDGMELAIAYDTEVKTDDVREYVLSNSESLNGKLTLHFGSEMSSRKTLDMKAEKEGGIAIYNLDTEALLLTTQLNIATTTFDPNGTLPDFGTFVAVLTDDVGWCGQKVLFDCLSASTTIDVSFFSIYAQESSKESKAVLARKEKIKTLLAPSPAVEIKKEIPQGSLSSSVVPILLREKKKEIGEIEIKKEIQKQSLDQSATSSDTLSNNAIQR